MPSSIRPAFAALWALDLAFADVISTSSDARLGAIRLAWWRERLEQLDGSVPAEPRLQAVVADLLPHGISGAELSGLEDGWAPLLEPFPWGDAQVQAIGDRGRLLFGIGARLLGGLPEEGEAIGALWSLQDAAVHCSGGRSSELLANAARQVAHDLPPRVPGRLRPLTILGALAAADALGKGRGLAALRHRLFGAFPR